MRSARGMTHVLVVASVVFAVVGVFWAAGHVGPTAPAASETNNAIDAGSEADAAPVYLASQDVDASSAESSGGPCCTDGRCPPGSFAACDCGPTWCSCFCVSRGPPYRYWNTCGPGYTTCCCP